MIDKIAEGIIHRFNQDETFGSILTGGLYFQRAPQDVEFSYGVFSIVSIVRDEIMGAAANGITEATIQFSIFTDASDGGAWLAGLMDRLATAYDWQIIQVDGYRCIKMQPEIVLPILYTDEIWQGSKDYSLGIQKE